MPGTHRGQEVSDPLELELQTAVSSEYWDSNLDPLEEEQVL